MTEISTVEARNQFSTLVNRAAFGNERIVLTRRGKDIAAIVPLEDLKLLENLENRIDLDDAREALRDAHEHGTVSWDELKQQLDL
jgi:prevent-host-death family protein